MLEEYIAPGGIMLQEVCRDWEDCIDRGTAPLLRSHAVLPSYPAAIKRIGVDDLDAARACGVRQRAE